MPVSVPVHKWERINIHIDYLGPFMGKMLLVIVDSYSKWVEVFPVSSYIPQTTINYLTLSCIMFGHLTILCTKRLRTCFATHGLPQICVSDNGSYFTSEELELFMKKNGICISNPLPSIRLQMDAQKDLLELLKTL